MNTQSTCQNQIERFTGFLLSEWECIVLDDLNLDIFNAQISGMVSVLTKNKQIYKTPGVLKNILPCFCIYQLFQLEQS